VGALRLEATARGDFEGRIPLPAEGVNALTLSASAPGYAPAALPLEVTRLAAAEWQRRAAELRARLAAHLAGAPPLSYAALAAGPEALRGSRARVTGAVHWVDRAEGASAQLLLLFTCPPASCPLWVSAAEAPWAHPGARVEVVGALDGELTHPVRGGVARRAPLLHAAAVAPEGR